MIYEKRSDEKIIATSESATSEPRRVNHSSEWITAIFGDLAIIKLITSIVTIPKLFAGLFTHLKC